MEQDAAGKALRSWPAGPTAGSLPPGRGIASNIPEHIAPALFLGRHGHVSREAFAVEALAVARELARRGQGTAAASGRRRHVRARPARLEALVRLARSLAYCGPTSRQRP